MNIYQLPNTSIHGVCLDAMNTSMTQMLWNRFWLSDSDLVLQSCKEPIFRIGSTRCCGD